ncbi:hypothetical protein [Microbacterium sp. ZW T5_56]|uniref:hypothetical protein n=1 Tax=Microbacterium sp. ZW T5_56 TaxID=3378081 RepID=UPI0038540629
MSDRTPRERAAARRYLWELMIPSALFVVLLVIVPIVIDPPEGSPLAIVIALLPLIPTVWMLIAVVRFTRTFDEYMRGFALRACAVGFGAAMITAVAGGIIEGAVGPLPNLVWAVFVVGMSAWGITLALSSIRDAR